MLLAVIVNDFEDKLIGDLAQYYHILNYENQPPHLIATLVSQLPSESRLVMHYSNKTITLNQVLMATMIDNLQTLVWQNTKNGHKGQNRPEAMLDTLLHKNEKKKNDNSKENLMAFDSPEEYELWRRGKING
jgi:hypothetical protein